MINAIIADDEYAIVSIITRFIENESLPVEIIGTADNGRDAINLIRNLKPQLAFLDIQMPVHNGLEVMERETDCAYIIVTAFDSFCYAQQALRLGAKDILLKPIERNQLIQAISRAVGWNFTKNPTVNGVLEYIENHYEEKIDLTGLSQMFYTNPCHLARIFKKNTGTSVVNYIHKVRIEKAKKLLDAGDSIKETAERTGYDSLNNFYKYFKNFEGVTPAMYNQK